MKITALMLVLAPGLALATSPQAGENLFHYHCSSCHTALRPPRPDQKATVVSQPKAPDLVKFVQGKRNEWRKAVTEWTQGAKSVDDHGGCQGRSLTPNEAEGLVEFLSGASVPEPLPHDQLLKADFQKAVGPVVPGAETIRTHGVKQ